MDSRPMTALDAADCLALFLLNAAPTTLVHITYENPVGAYVTEKIEAIIADRLAWWRSLDAQHRARVLNAAIDRMWPGVEQQNANMFPLSRPVAR